MNRRYLLAAVPALALAGCNTPTPQIVTDARLLAGGLQAVTNVLLASPAVATLDKAKITQANATVQEAAQAVIAAAGATATVTVQTLATAATTLAPLALRYLPADSPYALAANAALALLPVILAAAGVAARGGGAGDERGRDVVEARARLAAVR